MAPATAGTGVSVTFLVVDDDPGILVVLGAVLRRVGAHVLPATSFEDAVLRIEDVPPDADLVVISDFDLRSPRTGFDVLRVVRSRRPDARRVLMSAHSAADVLAAPGAEVVQDFLTKPFSLEEVRALASQ